ncbi:1-phosphofructokinase family hexose kinase [Microbacterium nymphoidis]|uniref:1-phosphofructokinase family hexose kinase n=1 Tax=Microbacterium nymphoidis TaxID=2898586 RepID=UPI001E491B3D|nr:hexose kinase [Microbacterium nymphoidis]MCD2498906.1 1-phosphofructokinase family hexose kinase [Microbacterium nymphoidis]
MTIVTLTLNPALDQTIRLTDALRPGDVQRADDQRTDAAGKGVNVARAISAAGAASIAVLPLADDDPYGPLLRATGLVIRAVPVSARVRTNLTLTAPNGETTKINLPGGALDDAELDAIIAVVVAAARGAEWLVLAGSVPPGVPADVYARIASTVRAALSPAPRIAVDAAGTALAAAVNAPASGRPDLIKPNEDELAELVGASALPDVSDVAAAASELVRGGIANVLVTLGGDGAILADADGVLATPAPRIQVSSTVGAGDSALAGYLLADTAGAGREERLRQAIRYGSAAATLPGTQPPSPADLGTEPLPVRAL